MNAANKPFVIGLTGNIASGKSVISQYLSNNGALSVDADLVAQATYLPGGPAYQSILERFGADLLLADGQINRGKLGRMVFRSEQDLKDLEAIIHPQVELAVRQIIHNNTLPVVVIEAIKLFESQIIQECDQVWVSAAGDQVRLQRLMDHRAMDESTAQTRINAQAPQAEKIARADQVIYTDASYQQTYEQTQAALTSLALNYPERNFQSGEGSYTFLRPAFFDQAAQLLSNESENYWGSEDLYRLLGQRTIIAETQSTQINQLLLWKVEHQLAMLLAAYPSRCHTPQMADSSYQAFEHFCQGVCQVIITPSREMPHPLARELGFLPGEDIPESVNPLAYTNFIRKYGLMPAETYQKSLT